MSKLVLDEDWLVGDYYPEELSDKPPKIPANHPSLPYNPALPIFWRTKAEEQAEKACKPFCELINASDPCRDDLTRYEDCLKNKIKEHESSRRYRKS